MPPTRAQLQVEAAGEAAKRWESAIPDRLRVKFVAADGGTADILAMAALSGLDERRFMISPQQTNVVELVHVALAFMVSGCNREIALQLTPGAELLERLHTAMVVPALQVTPAMVTTTNQITP